MSDMTQVTLDIESDIAGKLAKLAGGESKISQYLTCLVLKLHAKKYARGGEVDLEQAILEIYELLNEQKMYEQKVYVLQQQIRRLIAERQDFLSTSQTVNQRFDSQFNTILH
jgi:hypothetical protein